MKSYNADATGSVTSSSRINWGIEYDPFTMMPMREEKGTRTLDLQYDGKKERVLKIDNNKL